jgi:predicted RNA-binding protein YlxR (DUF448 family)
MSLLDHLTAIRDERGTLTPALVVDVARDPEHPLHSRFEWDDSVAAEKWRLEQASQLLRVVRLPADPSRPNDLRAFVAVKGKDSHRAEYVPTQEAMADEFARRLVLADMEREWKALRRRYQHMAEFAQLVLRDVQEGAA